MRSFIEEFDIEVKENNSNVSDEEDLDITESLLKSMPKDAGSDVLDLLDLEDIDSLDGDVDLDIGADDDDLF